MLRESDISVRGFALEISVGSRNLFETKSVAHFFSLTRIVY